jgi:hypothetical protein
VTAPTTASSREAEMRLLFVAYLLVIAAGLVYVIVIGALHT